MAVGVAVAVAVGVAIGTGVGMGMRSAQRRACSRRPASLKCTPSERQAAPRRSSVVAQPGIEVEARLPLVDARAAPADGHEADGHVEPRGEEVAQRRPGRAAAAGGDGLGIRRRPPAAGPVGGDAGVGGHEGGRAVVGRVRLPGGDEDLADAQRPDGRLGRRAACLESAGVDLVPTAGEGELAAEAAVGQVVVDDGPVARSAREAEDDAGARIEPHRAASHAEADGDAGLAAGVPLVDGEGQGGREPEVEGRRSGPHEHL